MKLELPPNWKYVHGINEANDLKNIPAAACPQCGGWTSSGGCSQHAKSKTKVLGRTGCTCIGGNKQKVKDGDGHAGGDGKEKLK